MHQWGHEKKADTNGSVYQCMPSLIKRLQAFVIQVHFYAAGPNYAEKGSAYMPLMIKKLGWNNLATEYEMNAIA